MKVCPCRRCISAPKVMSAMIKTGSDKILNGFGNGDCILADFGHHLYAISDATERFPRSSRNLLMRLANLFAYQDDLIWPFRMKTAVQMARDRQPYLHKTTLTAISIQQIGISRHLAISHGGDSRIMVVNTSDGTIQYQSNVDMNFAGRSRYSPELTLLELSNPCTRIFLVTDGFQDLLNFLGTGPSGRLPDILWQIPIHETAAFIENLVSSRTDQAVFDDIGCLMLDPFQDTADLPCLLMGGTSADEETSFQSALPDFQPCWIGAEKWHDHMDQLSCAGILIRNGEIIDKHDHEKYNDRIPLSDLPKAIGQ